MYEVEECEGWGGHFPHWLVTDGNFETLFDSEEEAIEYCEEMNLGEKSSHE
jgi:hypothetical protein